MIKKYLVQSDAFEGNITCYYGTNGMLREMAINTWNIQPDDHRHVLENMGYMLTDALLRELAQREGWTFRAAQIDLSFERFWTMYGYARNKIQAQRLWDKMSLHKRFETLVNLKAYLRYCKRNPTYSKQLPDTYLGGHTTDNWDKVPDFKTNG